MISNVVGFKIKVVFVIKMFFAIVLYNIKINFYNYKFFIFFFKR